PRFRSRGKQTLSLKPSERSWALTLGTGKERVSGSVAAPARQVFALADIQATEDARGFLPVTQASLGAGQDALGIRQTEPKTVPAHPPDLACRDAHHQGIRGHITGHDGAGSNEGIRPDRRATDDGRVGADGGPPADTGLLIEVPADDLAAWIDDVGEDAGRSE